MLVIYTIRTSRSRLAGCLLPYIEVGTSAGGHAVIGGEPSDLLYQEGTLGSYRCAVPEVEVMKGSQVA